KREQSTQNTKISAPGTDVLYQGLGIVVAKPCNGLPKGCSCLKNLKKPSLFSVAREILENKCFRSLLMRGTTSWFSRGAKSPVRRLTTLASPLLSDHLMILSS